MNVFTLLLTVFIFGSAAAQTEWVQRGADIDGEADDDNSGWALNTNADGSVVAIGALMNEGNGMVDAGHVRVYQSTEGDWVQLGEDIDGEADGDHSGVAVSLSADGMTIAIGAYHNSGSGLYAGHVRVFNFNGASWVQIGSDIDGEAQDDLSGYSLDLSSDGQIVAIGAPYNSAFKGHVRVYALSGDNWLQLGDDIEGEAPEDMFGNSVSLSSDGSILAVGAYRNDGAGIDAGHVRVFQYSGSSWDQKGLDIDGDAAGENLGYSISLNAGGTILAIGSPGNNGGGYYRGQVRVYEYIGESWIQKGQNINGDSDWTQLGNSVSLSADGLVLATGATYYSEYLGQVKVFDFEENTWSQIGNSIVGEADGDLSGFCVSLNSDGSKLAVGSPYNAGMGSYRGHVRVFNSCDPNSGTDVQTACNSFTWINGITYTANNNNATWVLTNEAGCDSIVTLNLTIIIVDVSVSVSGATLTSNAVGATYQWLDCNNANSQISGETNQSFTPTISGSYAVEVTQDNCVDTSSCYQVVISGTLNNDLSSGITFYPNPTTGYISINLGNVHENPVVKVLDYKGIPVETIQFKSTEKVSFELKGHKGLYFIDLKTADGSSAIIKVLKE